MRRAVGLVILAVLMSGCAMFKQQVVLHPITPDDIFVVPANTQVGQHVTKKSGYFLSDTYMEEVVKAKVQ